MISCFYWKFYHFKSC